MGSLFAGIGGFDLGFERAGIQPVWAVEIDPACQRVLRHHFPGLHIESDVREVGAHNLEPVDVITFGFPCQDLSVAGKRAGLVGARSGLFWEAMRVIKELRPAVAVAENVPGLLSSNGGRDMAHVLWGFLDAGAVDVVWAVLDAQWFGVAQRRRRVFVVADFGGTRSGEILALADGLSGHPAPRRETGQDVAGTLGVGTPNGGSRPDTDRMTFIPLVSPTQSEASDSPAAHGKVNGTDRVALVAHTLSAEGHDASEDGTGRGTPLIAVRTANTSSNGHGVAADVAHTIDGANEQAIAFTNRGIDSGTSAERLRAGSHGALPMVAATLTSNGDAQNGHRDEHGLIAFDWTQAGGNADEISPTLRVGTTGMGTSAVTAMAVRRLTPRECCRLQAFPDDWLDLDPPLADSAKYRMLGNAVCVAVTEWLARRIVTTHTEVGQS